ncbi:MAG: hypothetical protein J0L99_08045 [Chitinophagales bacterium]|nr:hypothetical protein [Chitinophagales bacterium]
MLFKRLAPLAFVVLLLAACVYFYQDVLHLPPTGQHGWSQGDRFAIALRYAEDGLNFFVPKTYDLATPEGITAVDAPWPDYMTALWMRLFDTEAPLVFRSWVLLFSLLAYWFLFRLAARQSGSITGAAVLALWVFSCPILVYYQVGFIPSASSLAAAWMAYEGYFRYRESGHWSGFYQALAMMTLAALCRSPFHIFLFALLLQEFWYGGWRKRQVWLGFLAAYSVLAAAWYWKQHIQNNYGSIFLNELMYAESAAAWIDYSKTVFKKWVFEVATPWHWAVWGVCLLLGWWKRRRISPIALQSGITLAGAGVYYTLMIRQFPDHEYYFMDSFYVPVVLVLLAAMRGIQDFNPRMVNLFWAAALLALVPAFLQSKTILHEKLYRPGDRTGETERNFAGSAALLDSLSIDKNARMLVIDAYSYNLPQIGMRRMGWPLLSTRRSVLEKALAELPYDYIAVQDHYFPSDVYSELPEILAQTERVGGNGRISLLRKKTSTSGSLGALLGMEMPAETLLAGGREPLHPAWRTDTARSLHTGTDEAFGPGWFEPVPATGMRLLWSAQILASRADKAFSVVASVEHAGQKLYYERFEWTPGTTATRPYAALFQVPAGLPADAELRCYIWNEQGNDLQVQSVAVLR